MTSTYTSNQTGAIATMLAAALWGLTATGAYTTWDVEWTPALTVFSILVVIGWILVPLYVKLIRPAFIVGIVAAVIALIGLTVVPTPLPWYTFPYPVYNFATLIAYLVMLAGIYFSYKSYRELK